MKTEQLAERRGDWKTPFSLSGYRALIQELMARGYVVRDFQHVLPHRPDLVIRHDIDVSLDAAVELARVENELGVACWYFPLLSSDFYNCLSLEGRRRLQDLLALGHRIGLHFDPAVCDGSIEGMNAAVREEVGVLEDIVGQRVEMVSLHRPKHQAQSLLGYDGDLGGRPHTYQRRYFSDLGYCSDSRGNWRFGHPLDHEAVQRGRALHLLTHPIWWAGGTDLGAQRKLDAFLRQRMENLGERLGENISGYAAPRAVR